MMFNDLLFYLIIIACYVKSTESLRCYEYDVKNTVSPGPNDLKKVVECAHLTRPACVKLTIRNSMKGLDEEAMKAFTTEGRCALHNDECPKSKVNKCFDEPSRNLFGIVQTVKKCCSTNELSNSAPAIYRSLSVLLCFLLVLFV